MADFGTERTIMWLKVLMVISLVLQLIGYVSPGWILMATETYSSHMGLWYLVVCITGASCQTVGVADYIHYSKIGTGFSNTNPMREFQIETTLALVACIASIALFHIARNKENNKTILITGSLCCALSGILSIVASAKIGRGLLTVHNTYLSIRTESPFKFPYSLVLTGLGAIVAGVTFIFFLVKRPCNPAQDSPSTQGVVMNTPAGYAVHNGSYPMENKAPGYYP